MGGGSEAIGDDKPNKEEAARVKRECERKGKGKKERESTLESKKKEKKENLCQMV